MNDTPKTDAAFAIFQDFPYDADGDPWALCAKLERQLAEASEQRDRLEEAGKVLADEYEDRRAQWGNEYLWTKHEDTERVNEAIAVVKGESQ